MGKQDHLKTIIWQNGTNSKTCRLLMNISALKDIGGFVWKLLDNFIEVPWNSYLFVPANYGERDIKMLRGRSVVNKIFFRT